MKKMMKLFGFVAVLTALPVAFTGGADEETLGFGLNQLCAEDGRPCLYALGSVCRTGPVPQYHKREAAPGF